MSPGPVASAGPPEAWLARPYPQLLRGPTHRWWRPLLSVAVMAGWLALLLMLSGLAIGVAMVAGGAEGLADEVSDAEFTRWATSPTGLAVTNLLLASLIVATQLAVWAGYGWRPRWAASIAGGIRWRWLALCYLVSAGFLAGTTVVLIALDGGVELRPEPNAAVLVAVVLLTTPLQAAGEEYFFRGWLTQVIGSAVARPAAGGVLAAVASACLFAFAHGQQDVWLWLDRFAFGLVASWLVWRTGGLEAAIAVHGVYNLVAFGVSVLAGDLSDLVEQTDGSAAGTAINLVISLLLAAGLDRLARRRGAQRLFRPPVRTWPAW